MLDKILINHEKLRSERSSRLAIACDITYNSVAVVYYDLEMHRNFARSSLVGESVTPDNSAETLAKLVVTSMREYSVKSYNIAKFGIAAPVHISHVLEQELSASDMYLSPDTEIEYVPYISAGISGRFTASLLTIPEEDYFAADIGRNLCIARKQGNKLECGAFSLVGAFDGSDLENGMPAEKGAVEAVRGEEDGTVAYEVVGDVDSKGIAPSAAVMAAELMLKRNVLDSDGIMTDRDLFYIGEDFFVSQKDIRAVQTDKARTAAALGLFPDVERCYFSGEPFSMPEGFSAMLKIGALPEKFGKSAFCRNSTERGIILFLENEQVRDKAYKIASEAEDISNLIYEQYHDNYLNCLNFELE